MSIYDQPDTVISPELTRRRQGKTCFNFTRIDDGLFDELAGLDCRRRASSTPRRVCCVDERAA